MIMLLSTNKIYRYVNIESESDVMIKLVKLVTHSSTMSNKLPKKLLKNHLVHEKIPTLTL
jgi:hypothetical protein